VAQSLSQHDTNGIPIGTFRVFVEASLSVRPYYCMSEEHCIEVDTRIDEIKYRHRVNDYEEICEMVTRYVEAHHALLQEAGKCLFGLTCQQMLSNMCYHSYNGDDKRNQFLAE
jgi:hypothetical protein